MSSNPFGNVFNNPLFHRAQQMAQGKTPQELEQVARNLCQQRGININDAMKQFNMIFGQRGNNNGMNRY